MKAVEIPENTIKTKGGRIVFRHPNGNGSVIEFDYWGTKKQLFVPDAKFHSIRSYDLEPMDHGIMIPQVTNKFFNGTDQCDSYYHGFDYSRSDRWIQQTFKNLRNDGTAKSNTDKLVKFITTVAAHYCRYIEIPGCEECDMPNLYEVIVMYLESNTLKKLGTFNEEVFCIMHRTAIWSSTECKLNGALCAMSVQAGGQVKELPQRYDLGVIPVKELN